MSNDVSNVPHTKKKKKKKKKKKNHTHTKKPGIFRSKENSLIKIYWMCTYSWGILCVCAREWFISLMAYQLMNYSMQKFD